ncbi:MAG: hypothetical protein ACI8XB_000167 [Patiriisocius sp.]|jgi:hypothetical protein
MNYLFSKKAKTVSMILMIIGVIGLVSRFVTDHSAHHDVFWSNLLINGLFFTFITFGALFFIALQYATETAWSVMARRIYEAILGFLPVGIVILCIVFLASTFHMNHIYHWMDSSVTNEFVMESTVNSDHPTYVNEMQEGAIANDHFDSIIAGKSSYLNPMFWWLRNLVYFATFLFFAWKFRKTSLEEDEVGGSEIHVRNYRRGALFLVFFAVFSSSIGWDWIMSIDTHWFSTMFSWQAFSGMWVTAMIVSLIMALYLKSKGLLPQLNESHVHDMGKWVFAISFLWTYLWFSQFMLIWYSDIPEEVTYYAVRFAHYGVPMWVVVGINFLLPMILLMSRDAKRNSNFLITVCTVIFFSHWFAVYMLVTPGVQHDHWSGLEFSEVAMMLGFLGLFIFVVLNTLSKANLVPKGSPFMDESIHHHI